MLATWGLEPELAVEPIFTAAKRREAQARRNRRHRPTAIVPIPTATPQQQPAQLSTPSSQPSAPSTVTVTVGLAPEDIDESLSDEELALREASINQARLRHAGLEGDVDTIDLLLRGSTVGRRPRPPVPPDAASDDGWTPLMYACLHGHYNAAQLLVSRGANVDAATALDDTPLTLSAAVCDGVTRYGENARAAIATLLLDAGADVNAANRMGMTVLHRAALQGTKAVARVVLRRGARPELLCKHGLSAVDRAAVASDVREIIVKAQLSEVGLGTAKKLGSVLRTDGNLGAQAMRQPSAEATMLLSEQVIDCHCSFSGVPSWQRVASIDSRLHELALRTGTDALVRGRRRTGSASMQLRKLNLSSNGENCVAVRHGGEIELHAIAEGKHILSPSEVQQLQASSFVSVSAQF